ncbi:MAG: DNA-directed RNA polymerase subunit L [Candidatus Aenigmarchaeota archaeon]|nr:DNA-directed RNA polymerase subunit L [Candidatus Aenigmarchaeota archaeon]
MKMTVLEKKKGKLTLEIEGEDQTLLNTLRINSWKSGAKQVAYAVKHPYLSSPEIIIRADSPKKVLKDAAQLLINDVETFQKQFSRAMK